MYKGERYLLFFFEEIIVFSLLFLWNDYKSGFCRRNKEGRLPGSKNGLKRNIKKIFPKICRFQNNAYLCIAFEKQDTLKKSFGEVAEWSIAAVLKTVVLRGTRGSNPCLSAINLENQGFMK